MLMIDPPPFLPTTVAAITQMRRVLDVVAEVVTDPEGDDLRAALMTAFSSVAYEHAESILLLSRHRGCFSTGMALFRPLIETIIRGEWLYLCAGDEIRTKFASKEWRFESSPFKTMGPDLDAFTGKPRFASYQPFYSQMCDYTHTGHDAVARRSHRADDLVRILAAEAQIRALLFQSSAALVEHHEVLCDLSGDIERVEKLRKMHSEIIEFS